MSAEWPPLNKLVGNVLAEARLHAGQGLAEAVGIEHLLLALLTCEEATGLGALGLSERDAERIREALLPGLGLMLLRRLFSIYVKRLLERGIRLEYDPEVLGWLLDQPGWRNSGNPLGNLKRFGEWRVAEQLEESLLAEKLRAGSMVSVRVAVSGGSTALEFSVRE
jgi:hypothetical protein